MLLVTDNFLYDAGMTAPIEALLAKNQISCAVYHSTRPNPTVDNVEEARAMYLAHGCGAIIALGGKAAVELRYAGQVAEGCSDDIACAVNCIREAAAKEGTLGFSLLNVESDSSSNMSESLNARSEAAVQAELERYYGKARALLAQNEAFLKEITEALVIKNTLLYSEIQAIRSAAVKRNPAVTCEAASRYDAAEIENFPPEDPEEAMRQKIMRKLEEAERRRCS